MGVPSDSSSATTRPRLKREDFRRTKHDSAFSQWKILIGASDWEDHSMGKEGAEKYRTQNLPNWTSCPGVYELGIAASRPKSGRETRKLDSSSIVPVYLGQADNLRNRLQQYGRDGAHLENGCSNFNIADDPSVSSRKGPGLFTNIFPRGLPIVYRCAPMKSKKDAEITEKQLLDKFDYAWNKGSNGARREHDIYKLLERREKASQFSFLAKKILFSNPRAVGIKIKTSSNSSDMGNNTIFSRIPGIRRLQARQEQYSRSDNCNDICGVSIGHGSVCTAAPVAGRKRCAMHKGLQVNGYISRLITEGIAAPIGGEQCNDICGVSIDHGSVCTAAPVAGRKRCAMHKGLQVNGYVSKLNREGIAAPIGGGQYGRGDNCNDICGVSLGHGSVCNAAPVAGRKRCAMHKGLQVNGYISKLNRGGMTAPNGGEQYGRGDNCNDICGVSIGHGSVCTAAPVAGRKRCAMHKGLQVNGYISKLNREGTAVPIGASMGSYFEDQKLIGFAPGEKFIPSCGFILEDGYPCARKPVQGNKRCLEHKGRRIRKSY